MKKIHIGVCLIFLVGCATQEGQKDLFSTITEGGWWVIKTTAKGSAIAQDNSYIYGPVKTGGPNIGINAYGYGVHSNRFGQAIKLKPDFGYVPGEQLYIQEDAYGFGVHSDQYGRPVREYPWP